MTRRRLVVVGSANMDLVVTLGRLPQPGETVLGEQVLTVPGGKGANQAVAAARLGARVNLVGRVGSDRDGRLLRASLRASGVGIRYLQPVAGPSGVAVVLVAADGENQIVVVPGANGLLAPADIEAAATAITRSDLVVAVLEVPLATVEAAFALARRAGRPTLLNAAPATPDARALLGLTTVLVVNEPELATLLGRPVSPGEEGEAAANLLSAGPAAVIVTLGERGALVVTPAGQQLVPAFAVTVVDTTAAGDAFVGGLAAAYRGLEQLREAVRFANAVGALACTRLGAQPALPSEAEVAALLARGSG
ncbi:MAG: ribokinase [Dehalococcoidia bacterium]|nr:MAG: ribokinase [Dehalococcoidia bacterium]